MSAAQLAQVYGFVIDAICDRCRRMRSRRGGYVVDLETRRHFLCAPCLRDLQRHTDRDFLRAADLGGAGEIH